MKATLEDGTVGYVIGQSVVAQTNWAGRFGGPLHEATRKGDIALVQTLLARSPERVFDEDADGCTPLHEAARTGKKDVAELLTAHGADINARTKGGWTPLHAAVSGEHKEIVEKLLASGAQVNAKTKDGATPLYCTKDKELVNMLVAHGADPRLASKQNRKFWLKFFLLCFLGPPLGTAIVLAGYHMEDSGPWTRADLQIFLKGSAILGSAFAFAASILLMGPLVRLLERSPALQIIAALIGRGFVFIVNAVLIGFVIFLMRSCPSH